MLHNERLRMIKRHAKMCITRFTLVISTWFTLRILKSIAFIFAQLSRPVICVWHVRERASAIYGVVDRERGGCIVPVPGTPGSHDITTCHCCCFCCFLHNKIKSNKVHVVFEIMKYIKPCQTYLEKVLYTGTKIFY